MIHVWLAAEILVVSGGRVGGRIHIGLHIWELMSVGIVLVS